jgi:hypothetical protein
MSDEWFYFGCNTTPGHFLFNERMHHVYRYGDSNDAHPLGKFDGALCYPKKLGPYKVAISILGGVDYTAFAFWDYTVDKRPGSNSIFFAPGRVEDVEFIRDEAFKRFPRIATRLPPLDLLL